MPLRAEPEREDSGEKCEAGERDLPLRQRDVH
jgi:hypothetical protein